MIWNVNSIGLWWYIVACLSKSVYYLHPITCMLFVWKKCTEKLIFLQTYWLIVHFGSKFITIKKVLFFLIFYMKMISLNKMNCELMLTYDTPALRQTGSRNLTGQNTLPTIWGTYMKLVTKYQISPINSCWEKCDEKCAYTNVC